MRLRRLLWAAVAGAALPGCSQIQDMKQDYLMSYRNQRLAEEAWSNLRHEYSNIYPTDFERGWFAGYLDAMSGGNGCPPALPPQRYWGVRYQNPVGQQRIMAWFNGYREGALVAEQDGVVAYTQVPTIYQKPEKAPKPVRTVVVPPRNGVPAAKPVIPGPPPAPPAPPVVYPDAIRPKNSTPNAKKTKEAAPAPKPEPPKLGVPEKTTSIKTKRKELTPIRDTTGWPTVVPLYATADKSKPK